MVATCVYFPAGAGMSDATDPQLESALLAAGAGMGLQLTPQQVERMMQLHLACEQRIGVIIMGPSGSGKSTLWQVSALLWADRVAASALWNLCASNTMTP